MARQRPRPDADAQAGERLLLLFRQGLFDEAETLARDTIAHRPGHGMAWKALGTLLGRRGASGEAVSVLRHAAELLPDDAETLTNLGFLLLEQGWHEEAATHLRRAVTVLPSHAKAWFALGVTLQAQDLRAEAEAEAAYREAIRLQPGNADAHNNLGSLLLTRQDFPRAELACREALRLQPGHADAWYNLGGALLGRMLPVEAETALRESIRLAPHLARGHLNLGTLLHRTQRLAEAAAAYRQALEIQPEYPLARYNLGLIHLNRGEYAPGWSLYEERFRITGPVLTARPPDPTIPTWRGEDPHGATLLVIGEQGFGDHIMHVRFLAELRARGFSRLTLITKAPLIPLFASLAGPDILLDEEAPDPAPCHDFQVCLASLPHLLGIDETNLPRPPYLHATPERLTAWRPLLPASGFRVGLVWKGGTDNSNDAWRSLPSLRALRPLWEVPGVIFMSLQKGAGEEEARSPPADQPLIHLGDRIRDFADSAALVAQLDLVICVDTAIAHLAGALARPCWILMPGFGPHWLWMEERADSPWYPKGLRIFRQKRPNEWEQVVSEVARALAEAVR
ncbi:MAG: tetratricopeptide repeat protein [Magnetococcales bacterium]|nr:tetratricopeptide repeat protein [Magnetococcales bacterium]